MTIDVVSDVVCPWCYIGKRRLEAALAERGAASKALVRWHPFQLNPDLPLGGADRRSYLENKFGGPERAQEIYTRVHAAGQEVGIWFEFERIDRQPNTMNAHRLIAWAQAARPSLVGDLVERLFRAYFTQGGQIPRVEVAAEAPVSGEGERAQLPDVAVALQGHRLDARARGRVLRGVRALNRVADAVAADRNGANPDPPF